MDIERSSLLSRREEKNQQTLELQEEPPPPLQDPAAAPAVRSDLEGAFCAFLFYLLAFCFLFFVSRSEIFQISSASFRFRSSDVLHRLGRLLTASHPSFWRSPRASGFGWRFVVPRSSVAEVLLRRSSRGVGCFWALRGVDLG